MSSDARDCDRDHFLVSPMNALTNELLITGSLCLVTLTPYRQIVDDSVLAFDTRESPMFLIRDESNLRKGQGFLNIELSKHNERVSSKIP